MLPPATATAVVHDLGQMGKLVTVSVPSIEHFEQPNADTANGKAGAQRPSPFFVFIVDRSGSMGQWSSRVVNQAIPTCLHALGVEPSTRLALITFDSVAARVASPAGGDPCVSELPGLDARARGSTNMTAALPELDRALASVPPERPVTLVVISDGGVDNINATVAAAEECVRTHSRRPGPVSVALYRLMTSSSAVPDTRALTCLGALNTVGKVPLVDLNTSANVPGMSVEASIAGIAEGLTEGLRASAVPCVPVTYAPVSSTSSTTTTSTSATSASASAAAGSVVFARLPGAPMQATVSVAAGRTTTLLLPATADPAGILCGGVPVHVTSSTPLQSEAPIAEYLEFLETQAKVWAVAGSYDAEIDRVIAWARGVQSLVSTFAASSAVQTGPVTTRDRARALVAKVQSGTQSVLNRMLTLANREKVQNLNSAQQAAFLRANTASTALAKRALKTDADLDFNDLARVSLAKIAAGLGAAAVDAAAPAGAAGASAEVSFYGQETFAEIVGVAAELAPAADQLGAAEVLPLVGGLGVCFRAVVSDLPDPWAVVVREVYVGCFLSEHDLRTAVLQGATQGLKFPGAGRDDAVITGVVPLRCLDPASYDLYARTPLADLQASVSLRGVLARVPHDQLARDAAVLVALSRQIGPARPATEAERFVLAGLLGNVSRALGTYARESVAALAEALCTRDDARAFLTGDMGVSGLVKPAALLLASPACAPLRADPARRGRFLAALYGLAAYHAARREFRPDAADPAAAAHARQV